MKRFIKVFWQLITVLVRLLEIIFNFATNDCWVLK